MKNLFSITTLLAGALAVGPAFAASLYSEGFDYGGANIGVATGNLGTWTSNSNVLQYDWDGGLDVPTMNGETGGALWLNFSDPRNASDSSLNVDMSGLAAGGTIWMAAIAEYVSGTGTAHSIQAQGGSVTGIGFEITSAGDVRVYGSNNGSATTTTDTGINAASGTYLLLLRATKGNTTDSFGVNNSVIDFWFDPSDTSSVGALGGADWTTGADSKFGRDSQSLTSIFAQPSEQGRIDEIRLGEDLIDVIGVPEPTSVALLGLGGLMLARRRRLIG